MDTVPGASASLIAHEPLDDSSATCSFRQSDFADFIDISCIGFGRKIACLELAGKQNPGQAQEYSQEIVHRISLISKILIIAVVEIAILNTRTEPNRATASA
jgi:hypothetical protein